MKKILTIFALLFSVIATAQQYHDKGAKFENATSVGDTISNSTRIPIIDEFGLVNYYVDVADLLALNPAPVLEWGNITGTLSNQTDLQGALNAKADQSDLTAHTSNGNIHFTQSAINITESQVSDLKDYLRGDINDTNGANKLTLGSLEVTGQTILQNGLNMSSVPVGTSDNILTLNGTTGDVEQRVFSLGDIDIANASGTNQFPVGLGDQLRFEGSGDTSISFDGVTNTINITSFPGSGTGGAVTSFNGRTGGVVSEAGDYSTAMVNELTNLYFTEPRVRATPLTGLTVTNTPISATNTFLQALGRLQGQINDRVDLSSGQTISSWKKIVPTNITADNGAGVITFGNNGTGSFISSGTGTGGDYSFILRGYESSGVQLDLNDGGISANGVITATGGNSTDWNTAFSWGNHANSGYITGSYTGFDSRYVNLSGDTMTGELRVNPNITGTTNLPKQIQLGATSNGSFIASGTNAGGSVSYVLRGYQSNGVQMTLNEGAISAQGEIAIRAVGTGTGTANLARLGFYESNGTVEQGYVGFASDTRSDLNIRNFTGNTLLQLREEGGVNGLQYIYNGNVFNDVYHSGNLTLSTLGGVPTTRTITAGDGLVGGGNLSGNITLDVVGSGGITTTGNAITLTPIAAGSTSFGALQYQGTSRSAGKLYGGSTNPISTTRLNYDGNLYVSNLTSIGDVIANSSSDRRLKDDIRRIENPLKKLSKLTGNEFKWNDKQETYDVGQRDYGVLAQEVRKVLPHAVDRRDNGYLAVDYKDIIPLLIEAIKELQNEIKELKDEK